MLAGVGGIDVAILVVAADEGIMPQTEEHLAICDLLRIQRGLVALTKIDLVETDWLEMVTEDVRDGQDVFARRADCAGFLENRRGAGRLAASVRRVGRASD